MVDLEGEVLVDYYEDLRSDAGRTALDAEEELNDFSF